MQKKTLAVGLATALFSTISFAQSTEVPSLQFSQDKFDFKLSQRSVDSTQPESFDSSIGTQNTAEGITYYEVLGVSSTTYGGYEYPDTSATSTTYDHGGTIEVAVAQYGYGNDNGATLGAVQPTSVTSQPHCGSLSNFHPCTQGETITGYMYFYTFTSSEGGYFTSSATSVASPYGTSSDSIYIK